MHSPSIHDIIVSSSRRRRTRFAAVGEAPTSADSGAAAPGVAAGQPVARRRGGDEPRDRRSLLGMDHRRRR